MTKMNNKGETDIQTQQIYKLIWKPSIDKGETGIQTQQIYIC